MIKTLLSLTLSYFVCFFMAQDASAANETAPIPVYSYYATPPFHFPDTKTGLVKEVLDAIDNATDDVSFSFQITSRPKLSALLKSEKTAFIVPFSHPIWFDDKERTKYLWSRPLFSDHNALISNIHDSIEFKGIYSFIFQKVGVPKGYSIYLLDGLVAKNKAERIDVPTIPTLIKMVQRQTIKMAVIPYASAHYYVDHEGLSDQIYFSKRPHQTYDRHLMLVNGDAKTSSAIDAAIKIIKDNGTLDQILKKYGY